MFTDFFIRTVPASIWVGVTVFKIVIVYKKRNYIMLYLLLYYILKYHLSFEQQIQ